ncbi:hypothetical protein LSUE1_G005021 [Lachnellula suecica]|uniref:Uncharacterized protein n=1 Tax=Lachnellula suecica TaxID=602035 RepID=A0A8T9BZU1_9HELO|nr:hypothetical protein LSUE1_G005021 [Lachnellula suecica]
MAFFFKSRPRTSSIDLPKQAREQISKLDGPSGPAKAEELAKTLGQIKLTLQGTQGASYLSLDVALRYLLTPAV